MGDFVFQVQEQGCRAIAHLAMTPPINSRLGALGAIDLAVLAVKSHVSEAQVQFFCVQLGLQCYGFSYYHANRVVSFDMYLFI